jgi:hypothetical protein
MSINNPSNTNQSPLLDILRTAALIATAAGAIGSLVFMFRAGQESPRLLLVLFTFWILFPFAALVWANIVSRRWLVMTRAALFCVSLLVALGDLAAYSGLVDLKPQGSPNAFLFVIVPPLSLLFAIIVIAMAALISRRLAARAQ